MQLYREVCKGKETCCYLLWHVFSFALLESDFPRIFFGFFHMCVVSDGAIGTIIAKSQTNGFIEKSYKYEFTIF